MTIGPREHLAIAACVAGEANWLGDAGVFRDWTPCIAQYRYNAAPVPAEARVITDGTDATPSGRHGRFEVRFELPQNAVTPGQALVLYDAADPDAVLGGGWIQDVRRSE